MGWRSGEIKVSRIRISLYPHYDERGLSHKLQYDKKFMAFL